ncbi:MAG TPA: glycosyltransferase family 2 protein [bacterium]|nr:glycosyltransferase family 2 protein [bacterium]
MDISISIVNYHSQEVIFRCLESLRATDWHKLEFEIFVVDNASEEDLASKIAKDWPEVRYIGNRNSGYGAGNNLALKQATGKYCLILNPDTVLAPDTIWQLYNFMESHHQIGVVGPAQRNLDGSRQASCYRWHRLTTPFCRRINGLSRYKWVNRELRRFLMEDVDLGHPQAVDWLLGSCLFTRAAALRQIDYFDQRYRLYFEDTDFCRQMWYRGWQVSYYPLTEVLHNHLRTSASMPLYKVFFSWAGRQHIFSWIKYLLKWGLFAKSHVPHNR